MTGTLWGSIPPAWQPLLSGCRDDIDSIENLLMARKRSGVVVVPTGEKIFAALRILPKDVSVIVIGQDPYPAIDHAIGLAFAVPRESKPLPGSLRNMFKEVESDIGQPSSADCTLQTWVDQGVLLLNTSLTTEAGVRGAHSSWPWESIVRTVIQGVVGVNPQVAALLLGNHAKTFSDLFDADSIVSSVHPSPLSASRGFFESRPFSRINRVLETNRKCSIRW